MWNSDVKLHTERCMLIALSAENIHGIFQSRNKAEIMQELYLDEKGYALYLSMHKKGMQTYRYNVMFFIVYLKESNRIIGECGFHTIYAAHGRAEVFYILRKDEYKQKGYMNEVLPLLMEYGFSELKLNRIEALVANYNVPSVKLLKRLGFTREGTKRQDYLVDGKYEDSEIYSLLREEWILQ